MKRGEKPYISAVKAEMKNLYQEKYRFFIKGRKHSLKGFTVEHEISACVYI